MEQGAVQVIPVGDSYVTRAELDDENSEFIFVQHAETVPQEQVETALKRFLRKKADRTLSITEISGQAPVYPVAFDEGGLKLSRKVDRYLFAGLRK
jgi:hypothetical protein